MNDTNKIRLVHITLYNFAARIVFFVFVLLAGVYASRFFSKTEFGHAQYISWMVSFSWLLFNLGAPATLNRYLAQGTSDQDTTRMLTRFSIAMTACALLLSSAAWYIYAEYTHEAWSFAAFAYLVTFIVANFMQVVMQARFLYRQLFVVALAAAIGGAAALWVLLPVFGVEGYIWSFALANGIFILGYGLSLFSTKNRFESTTREKVTASALMRTTLYFGVSSVLASIVWQRTELYFIREHLDYAALAIYGVALSLVSLATELLRILPGSLLSYFSAIKDNHDLVQSRLYVFTRYFVWIAVFICLFTAAGAETLIRFLYTDNYLGSARYVRILMLGFFPGVCSYIIMNLHIGLGRSRFLMLQDAGSAILFLASCFLLIPAFGLDGAAWAKALTLVFAVGCGIYYTVKRLSFSLPFRYIISSLVLASAILLPSRYLLDDNIIELAIKGVLAFVLYYSVSLRMGIIEKHTLDNIMADIKKMWTRESKADQAP